MAYRESEKMRKRKQKIRQQILDCAYLRVASGGFRNAPIVEVAAEAHVAIGTIYRHFESKESLFAEIFQLATQRELSKVNAALVTSGDAIVRLEAALRQFAQRALNGPVMAWALIAEPVDPKVEEQRLRYRRAYAELFEGTITQGIIEGSIPTQNARQTSTCLVGAIAESLVGPLSPARESSHSDTNHTQLINTIVRFCLQGLTGPGRPS